MTYSKIPLAQTIVQLCKSYGFKNVVISPGSRNAPLIIGFMEDEFFNCYSIVDERCAAFFGMGISQQTGIPTVLICTSGSAVLNYYPAVAESYFSNIPLIIISADRPKHLLNVGDGQTINQENVFENHVAYSCNLKIDISPEKAVKNPEKLEIFKSLENNLERFIGIQKGIQESNEVEINKAFNLAITKSSPVHINVPFDEPLYVTTENLLVHPTLMRPLDPKKESVLVDLDSYAEAWNSAHKKMVIIGVLQPNAIEKELIDTLAKDESVLIFTETTSNIHSALTFPSIDKIIAPLNEADFKELQPEILLTFGGMVISKKIKAFLRTHSPEQHWHVGENPALDTYFKLNKTFNLSSNDFLREFLPKLNTNKTDYRTKWELVKEKRKIKHKEYIDKIDFSDFKAFDIILKNITDKIVLQLSNSATIRYAQLFDIPGNIEVFCNRGTSGIDGSTSTAVGCSVQRKEQTLLITGDLSFFYDSNALWNDYIPSHFRIIVVNNHGGGIFRILPGDKNSTNFENYFETIHNLNSKHLCSMFDFEYFEALDEQELSTNLKTFFNPSERPRLLEIFTPRKENDKILLEYFEHLK
ncbi:2-succinyl-5-enolpyruvyl-6-hydroxy-3-cyclohexene-1-carboxylate synthase [Flavobacteriaceae bacterium MAR_2010_188]|nr:2-succinyl-5-enolpyruvyl-6-hydroxy-3-cyclohexene-1-carboxylate synthase [Flavobacteriaceae bacterium MAR_2010_188]